MASLVSLLLTDIVGSTRLWADHDQPMAADLARHDELAARIVAAAGGSVVKHTGDGVVAVFADPAAAVTAAVELQRAVAAGPWQVPGGLQVRAAVSSGAVHERAGDVFGTPVNRAARLLGVSPPGAVVVSAVTAALLADRPVDAVVVRPVGTVQLRGFAHPEHVFAAVAAGVETPVRLAEAAPVHRGLGNLPPIEDDLVGRMRELAAVWEAIRAQPLVTLVGVGGMGKTRLALEAAVGIAHEFPDGGWWVDLSSATSAEAVLPVTLEAVDAREVPGRTPLDSLTDHLAHRRALVVLDNCEHVLEPVRMVVRALRAVCPGVRVLATSREALDVRGEQPIPVGSLPAADAAALFVERARAARPDLDLTADDRAIVAAVCERLDGIPLAIELAAARCRSLSPAELHARLDDRFRLLRSGRAGAERHRTLRAAVAWSYSLLDDAERDLFDQMAVFAGGTLLDGLAAVADLDEYGALDLVERLIARSMVVPVTTALGTRYRQLETLRQYAEDRLVERGTITEVRDRHLAWARALAGWIGAAWHDADAADGVRRYAAELDNLRVAVAHAVGTGQTGAAAEIVGRVWGPAFYRPTFEVADWLDPGSAAPPWTQPAVDAVATAALLGFGRGDVEALTGCWRSIPEAARAGIPALWCGVLALALPQGDADSAERLLDEFPTRTPPEQRAARVRPHAGGLHACGFVTVGSHGRVDPSEADRWVAFATEVIAEAA